MENVQKSFKAQNSIVEKKRGFKPSDRHDPTKKQFLTQLSQQIWQKKNEPSSIAKKIDLDKILTPATDIEGLLPKNRKLYASSAFYSPTLHPTVEDQVELARRISHSLSDISNQQSRGQSMYVNRKKRSVKWIHEGCGQDDIENTKETREAECNPEEKENNINQQKKAPLQMFDTNAVLELGSKETDISTSHVVGELMSVSQTQEEKDAELFTKRRKKAEKRAVDELNASAQSPSGLPDFQRHQQQPNTSTSPSILPAYTDVAKHRVQMNLHQAQLLEKYARPDLGTDRITLEKTLCSHSGIPAYTPSSTSLDSGANQEHQDTPYVSKNIDSNSSQQQAQHERKLIIGTNYKRELAYKPTIPQAWKAPSIQLPKDLYIPKEIPLQSYAPPPVSTILAKASDFLTDNNSGTNNLSSVQSQRASPVAKTDTGNITFPVSKRYQEGFSTQYGNNQPPKQQYLPPDSYQTVPQNTSQSVPQVNFNPSPLPYDKLAKFENQPADESRYIDSPSSVVSYLNVRRNKVYNTSPAPFSGLNNKSYPESSAFSPQAHTVSSIQPPSRQSPRKLQTGFNYSEGQHISTVNAAGMHYTDF